MPILNPLANQKMDEFRFELVPFTIFIISSKLFNNFKTLLSG